MPDISTKSSSSPWDEPLDEVVDEKPKQPTVVGDLDFNKSTTQNTEEKVTEPLKVPENVEEKVGAKVEASQVVPVQGTDKAMTKNQPQNPPKQTTSESKDDDFWKNAYSNTPPTRNVAVNASSEINNTTVSKPVVNTSPQPNQQQKPVYPVQDSPQQLQRNVATNPQTQVNNEHLYQPVSQSVTKQSPVPQQQASVAPKPSYNKDSANKKIPIKTIIFAAILGLFVLFAGGIYLTEAGFISLGLEKFYGLLHLEAIWGGLPANPQNAIVLSAQEMQKKSSYKVSGEATVIVNRGVKSDIISPIIALSTLPIAINNPDFSQGIKTVLAAYEQDETSSTSSTQPSVSSASSGSSQKPTVEEFEVSLSSAFDSKISGADIKLKSNSKPSSSLNLVYSAGKIYLKSSSNIVFNTKVDGGWLSYDLKNFKESNPSTEFWSSNISNSDFSVTGSRQSSQVIDGVRCFRYSAIVNIGGAFANFGLTDSSLSSLELEYWIGARDHLIRQLKLKAVPTSKSAISRIDLTLNFSDYDSEDSGYIIPATSTPSVLGFSTNSQSDSSAINQTVTSRDQERKSDLANIAKALENYKLTGGSYPVSLGQEKISASSGAIYNSLVPNYLSLVPLDPNDPTYYYGYESDGDSYTLSAVLENDSDTDGRRIGSKNIYFLKSQ